MTSQERVRLLIGDLDAANYFFTALQIDEFLTLKGGNIWLSAATGLRVIAANLSRKKKLTIGSYSKESAIKELLDLAKEYEDIAESAGVDATGESIFYDGIVEKIQTEFNAEEIIHNVALSQFIAGD